jgi:hypothetical protein
MHRYANMYGESDRQYLSDRDIQCLPSRSTHSAERRHRDGDGHEHSLGNQLRNNVQRQLCQRDTCHADCDPQ